MSSLPRGWGRVRLRDLGDEVRGSVKPDPTTTYELYSVPAYPSGRPEILSGEEIRSSKRPVEPGDVLLCKINPRINRVWIVAEPIGVGPQIASTEYLVFRTPDPVLASYLRWYLQSPAFRRWIELSVEGATGSHTRAKSGPILDQPIPVPPSGEQERIVAAIEEHLSRLDSAETSLRSAEARLRTLESRAVDDAFLSLDARVPVGEVADVRGGIQKQPKRKPKDNPAPFLRVANVGHGRMDLREVHEVELFDGELERFRLQPGDLLVVEGNGSPDQIGRSALWRGEIDDCVHQNHLIRVRPGPELHPEFLGLYWNAPSTRAQLTAVASSTSGLHTLSTAKVKRIEVPVVPMDQQEAVVARLTEQIARFDHLRASLRMATSRQATLRRSVLAAAFSGQLVPQDPDDEPASVLLERIRAERAAAAPTKRTRKVKAL